ncbi:ATP-dependent DNA helicase [Yinghuangia soli]|uniref:ATP-dependent helicase DinG n=1 Tax=Yinghuangia soli TaxID=2908204 RepID=A0AA41Q8A3_9ACTN|nr:ATP-dependent DNA helicase [Yinghuangia soli]MCF2533051.1 ATP-dependent DNA helicase [Yinghuangia soli]
MSDTAEHDAPEDLDGTTDADRGPDGTPEDTGTLDAGIDGTSDEAAEDDDGDSEYDEDDSEDEDDEQDEDTAGAPTAAPGGRPDLGQLLTAAVAAVGGTERPGQVRMAEAVAGAVARREHLLVQAGTGTGKSLAYLVPALAGRRRVVVATATLALQRQLVERDLPRTVDALHPLLRRRPTFATLKGRSNYVCLHRLHDGPPDDGEVLFDPSPTSQTGRDIIRIRDWADDDTETGDRDDLSPGVNDRAWAQVSVSSTECLGAAKCPYGQECFAERAREIAKQSDIIVTNHALLAIDALEGAPVLPEHEVLVVDEAHELAARVTSVATDDLTIGSVERAARRAAKLANEKAVDALQAAAEAYAKAMSMREPARLDEPDPDLGWALAALRDASRGVITSLGEVRDKSLTDEDAARRQAMAAVQNVHDTCERILSGSPYDVLWIERSDRVGPSLRIAPLAVAGLLRESLFGDRTVVLTSATLKLGGDFTGVARTLGLSPEGLLPEPGEAVPVAKVLGKPKPAPKTKPKAKSKTKADVPADLDDDIDPDTDAELAPWRSMDVGSPYEYPKQGILYVAKHLPPPGRDGMHPDTLDELAELIECAGGRTLGLFSSRRAAEAATEALRERLDFPILCQGDDSLPELLKAFAGDVRACLFGTLSLWQGVDVPGPACQLVVMDRIPFPRPDDPLMSARAHAVHQAGGNGFMAVSATHAALLMAQGAGRLVRAADDRGVVAVLDSRLATKQYGGFFRSSMPDFWYTTDRNQVRRSLSAIDV